MVILLPADLIGKAERRRDFHLVFIHVAAVASLALRLPELRRGERLVLRDLADIVQNAVFVEILGLVKLTGRALAAEPEGNAGIHNRLPFQRILVILLRNVNIREHVEVGQPVKARTGLFPVRRRLFHLADQLTPLEMERIQISVSSDGGVKIARGILRRARAESIQTQRVFIVAAGVVLVLASRVELAEHQLPVVSALFLVPVDRAAAPEVRHLDRVVQIARDDDQVSVPLARLVDGVRENFKYGMLAAVQTVGAENDCRTLSDPVRALECGDAVVAVGLLFFHCVSSPVFVRLLGIITHYIVFSIPFFGLEVKDAPVLKFLWKTAKGTLESLAYFRAGYRLQSGSIQGIIFYDSIMAACLVFSHAVCWNFEIRGNT